MNNGAQNKCQVSYNIHYNVSISHTWIYQYAEKDRAEGGELSNYMCRDKYSFEPIQNIKVKSKKRVTIDKRHDVINQRK